MRATPLTASTVLAARPAESLLDGGRSDPRPAHIAPAEWSARVPLAAAYRIFDRLGWTDLI